MIGCPCLTSALLILVFIKNKTTFPINPFAHNTSVLFQGVHVTISILLTKWMKPNIAQFFIFFLQKHQSDSNYMSLFEQKIYIVQPFASLNQKELNQIEQNKLI